MTPGSAITNVRAGLSLSRIQAISRHITMVIIWIGLAGLLGVFVIAMRISRPVEMLTRAIERVMSPQEDLGRMHEGYATLETIAISNHFEELVEQLEERTRQLDASKKLAYLGELASCIAHEVNNPLGIIVMNSDFLAGRAAAGQLPPDVMAEVERLSSAARRVTLAVRKLLQFARYTTEGEPARHKSVDVSHLIHETIELLRDRLDVARCTIKTEIQPEMPAIPCDAQGIQQVVFNLLTNAIDASPEGSEIIVDAGLENGLAFIRVIDHGDGMSEKRLPRPRNYSSPPRPRVTAQDWASPSPSPLSALTMAN